MAQIRNASVARGHLTAAGFYSLYTVPTGFVFLVKSLGVWNLGTTTGTNQLAYISTSPAINILMEGHDLTTGTALNIQTWFAVNGGDSVGLNTNQTGTNYSLSGALLPTQVQFATALAQQESSRSSLPQTELPPQPLPPGTKGDPMPILLLPPIGIVSPA